MTKNELFAKLNNMTVEIKEIDDGVLFHGFNQIYKQSRGGVYNPIEEKLLLYSVIMNGLYGVSFEDFSNITKENGSFNVVKILGEIFDDINEVDFYIGLYKEFVVEQRSVNKAMEGFAHSVEAALTQFDPKVLQEQAEKVGEKLDKLGLFKEENNKTN